MSARILIVDDEPFILRSLSFVLRRAGYDVVEAHDGVEGLELARSEKPDLVFLDVMMPRKNGYEVLEEMRADPELAETVVFMLTAKGQDADRDRSLALGASEFMTKPYSPQRVLERVAARLPEA